MQRATLRTFDLPIAYLGSPAGVRHGAVVEAAQQSHNSEPPRFRFTTATTSTADAPQNGPARTDLQSPNPKSHTDETTRLLPPQKGSTAKAIGYALNSV